MMRGKNNWIKLTTFYGEISVWNHDNKTSALHLSDDNTWHWHFVNHVALRVFFTNTKSIASSDVFIIGSGLLMCCVCFCLSLEKTSVTRILGLSQWNGHIWRHYWSFASCLLDEWGMWCVDLGTRKSNSDDFSLSIQELIRTVGTDSRTRLWTDKLNGHLGPLVGSNLSRKRFNSKIIRLASRCLEVSVSSDHRTGNLEYSWTV